LLRDAAIRSSRGSDLPHALLRGSKYSPRTQEVLVEQPDLLLSSGNVGFLRRDIGGLLRQQGLSEALPTYQPDQQLLPLPEAPSFLKAAC